MLKIERYEQVRNVAQSDSLLVALHSLTFKGDAPKGYWWGEKRAYGVSERSKF